MAGEGGDINVRNIIWLPSVDSLTGESNLQFRYMPLIGNRTDNFLVLGMTLN